MSKIENITLVEQKAILFVRNYRTVYEKTNGKSASNAKVIANLKLNGIPNSVRQRATCVA